MFSCIGTDYEKRDTLFKFDFEGMKDMLCMFFRKLDDLTARSFARNYGGHPRSDIALLNEQNDLNGMTAIVNRIEERHGDGFNPDVPDAEIRIAFKSRYCQTASEMIQYYDNILAERDRRATEHMEGEAKKKADAELKAKRDELIATLTPDEKEYIRKLKRERDLDSLID